MIKSLHDPVKKHASATCMVTDGEHVYILFSDKSIEKCAGDNIEKVIAKTDKLTSLGASKGEAVTITVGGDKLYVGDSKGFMHKFNSGDLKPCGQDELKTIYGHPCMSIDVSKDGKYVAVGDVKGYVTVWDATSDAQMSYTSFHQNKILSLQFSSDGKSLMTLGFDNLATLSSVEDPKQVIKIKSPNDA